MNSIIILQQFRTNTYTYIFSNIIQFLVLINGPHKTDRPAVPCLYADPPRLKRNTG